MGEAEHGFSWKGALILVAVLALAVIVAIPGLLRARMAANEGAAIGALRTIATSQYSFQVNREVDQDRDGVGEYGLLNELSGNTRLRGAGGRQTDKPVVTTYITSKLAAQNEQGFAVKSGFCFKIYLPHQGEMLSDKKDGVMGSRDQESIDAQEFYFIAYAWPLVFGSTGTQCVAN